MPYLKDWREQKFHCLLRWDVQELDSQWLKNPKRIFTRVTTTELKL
ncbi:hypothetical protein EMIT0P253_20111 [Pseudomonas sp. IT-P253]